MGVILRPLRSGQFRRVAAVDSCVQRIRPDVSRDIGASFVTSGDAFEYFTSAGARCSCAAPARRDILFAAAFLRCSRELHDQP
jgi:hypothetical protein